jgi:hypothetical protein
MNKTVISAAKTTGLVLAFALAGFLFLGFNSLLFGEEFAKGVMMIPVISGFIHAGFDHLLLNLIMLFLLLLPEVNRRYDINRIFWLTALISTLYLPLALLELCPPAVGISGTAYFLMSRFFWSRTSYATLAKCTLGLLIVGELGAMSEGDDIAHMVHFIGAAMGVISLREGLLERITPTWVYSRI